MGLTRVVGDIMEGVQQAEKKHGRLTTDPVRACAIMVREAGEAMNEALLMTVPGALITAHARGLLYEELKQTAATCATIMNNLKEGV